MREASACIQSGLLRKVSFRNPVFNRFGECGDGVSAFESPDRTSSVIQVRSENGEGTMVAYQAFPGAFITYDDFHMDSCVSQFEPRTDLFCIDHCREGRLEQSLGDSTLSYMAAGDLKLDDRSTHQSEFFFPLSHYHGITVTFDLSVADQYLCRMLDGFPVDLHALKTKYCSSSRPYILHGVESVRHIFSELYAVPAAIREPYFKIKILELLLFLDTLVLPENRQSRPYFYRSQVEKVKAAYEFMCMDLARHYTASDLARRFGLSLTAFRACFKGVYGQPYFTYMREYRMNKAAVDLRTTNLSVSAIACQVGYTSSSKFAAAFKEIFDESPLSYRKSYQPMHADISI